jgi:hypothetical protein
MLRSGASVVFGMVVFAGAPIAQEQRFDPERDLPGFTASRSSEHRDLFDHRAFTRLANQELTAEDLAAVRQRWAAEQERVAQRLASIGSDPLHARAYALEQRVRRQPAFAAADLLTHLDHLPFVFFLPRAPAPHHDRRIVWRYLPWLQVARASIAELFADSGEPAASDGVLGIVVLPGAAAHRAALAGGPARELIVGDACFDTDLRAIVTFEEEGIVEREARLAVLRAFVRGSLPAEAAASAPLWVSEGLAEYFSGPAATRPEDLRAPGADPTAQRLVADACADATTSALASSFEELLAPRANDFGAIEAAVRRRAPDRMLTPAAARLARSLFRAQSGLLVAYLLEGQPRRRDAARRYLRAALHGAGGSDALAAALGTPLPALQAEFELWQSGRSTDPAPAAAPAAAIRTSAPAPAAPAPVFDATRLAFGADETRLRLAAAVDLATRGLLGSAAATVAGSHEVRLQREHARLTALIAWREQLLAACQRGRRPLTVTSPAGETQGQVHAWSQDAITVASGDGGRIVGHAAAAELFQAGLRQRAFDTASQWLGGLLQALAQAPIAHARGKLRGNAAAAALAADLDDYYDRELRAAGGGAALIASIASQGALAGDAQGSRAALAALAAGLAAHRDTPAVAARLPLLAEYARALLWRAFDLERNECLALAGEVQRLPDGAVLVRYEFSDPRALRDFEPDADPFRGRALLPFGRPEVAVGSGLEVRGDVALRHVLPLAAPVRVACVATLPDDGHLRLCLAEDGGSACAVTDFGHLVVRHGDRPTATAGRGLDQVFVGREYGYELTHDGAAIAAACDGRHTAPAQPMAPLTAATCRLAVTGREAVRFASLEIRGHLAPEATEGIRARWIRRQLEALLGGNLDFVQDWRIDPELAPWDGAAPALPDAETVSQWTTWTRTQLPRRSPSAAFRSVDLERVFPGATWCSARLLARLRVPRGGPARLRLGADDGVRIWLNGEMVVDRVEVAVLATDSVDVPIALRDGVNELLVQSFQGPGGWGLSLRSSDAQGRPLLVADE